MSVDRAEAVAILFGGLLELPLLVPHAQQLTTRPCLSLQRPMRGGHREAQRTWGPFFIPSWMLMAWSRASLLNSSATLSGTLTYHPPPIHCKTHGCSCFSGVPRTSMAQGSSAPSSAFGNKRLGVVIVSALPAPDHAPMMTNVIVLSPTRQRKFSRRVDRRSKLSTGHS